MSISQTARNERLDKVYQIIDENRNKYALHLRQLLRQRSIASTGQGIKETAKMVHQYLEAVGAKSEIVPSTRGGSPIVFGELKTSAAKRTLLIYGMYDTVSVDYPEQWSSPPWEANIVNGRVIGRGAVNTKGPLVAFIDSVSAVQEAGLQVPVNLIFVIEGEEETGSPSLPAFLENYAPRLSKADAMFMPLASQFFGERVELHFGTNGLLFVDLELRDKKYDTSGWTSPILGNPAWRIVDALSSIRDRRGKVAIEGWYDKMKPASEFELGLTERLAADVDEDAVKKAMGVTEFEGGLKGVELWKKLYFEPRFNLMGIAAGYYGPGTKSTTPSWCRAKVAFSMLPEMDVDESLEKLKKHLCERGFKDIEVKTQLTIQYTRLDPNNSIIQAMIRSYRRLGKEPLLHPYLPGSGPFYLFHKSPYLQMPIGLGGFGYLYMSHRVDEFMTVEQYLNNVKFCATVMEEFAATP